MTAKQFENLWVGSIVHIERWAWRVKVIDREHGRVLLRKMPEVASLGVVTRTAPYRDLAYVPTQKPPVGQNLWDEEEQT